MAFVARAERPSIPGIKRVSIKHEAILNFLLAHPLVKMRDVAAHFEVSQPWLSLVIHSDAFQRKLRERQDVHFDASILPLMDRMQMLAEKSIDRLLECVPFETDTGKLNNIADKTLNRLGYGTNTHAPATVNVQVNVQAEALQRARQLIGARPQALLEEPAQAAPSRSNLLPALEVQGYALGGAEEVSQSGGRSVGATYSSAPLSTVPIEDAP